MRNLLVVCVLTISLSGCAALGLGLDLESEYKYTDPATGETITTTVGEAMADGLDTTGGAVADVAGKAIGVATGNPVIGMTAAALLAALVGSGASSLRKKRRVGMPADPEPAEPKA